MKLYLTYEETSTGGEPRDPSDRWTDYTTEHRIFEMKQLFLDRPEDWEVEEVEVSGHSLVNHGDVLFVVLVRYSTGDTFTDVRGCWNIPIICTDKVKAANIVESIKNGSYLLDKYHPWVGYFETLESVDVHPMVVL